MTTKTQRPSPVPFVEYLLKKYVPPSGLLLDVGCGPALYRKTTPARYIGFDLVPRSNLADRPRFVDLIASGMEIPVRRNTIDVVFVKSALYQFADPQKALAEFCRVLKPAGRVLIVDYNRRTQKRLKKKEGQKRPCWTQWELKALCRQAGFKNCKLLLPFARDIRRGLRWFYLLGQEIVGQCAIVTGVK